MSIGYFSRTHACTLIEVDVAKLVTLSNEYEKVKLWTSQTVADKQSSSKLVVLSSSELAELVRF